MALSLNYIKTSIKQEWYSYGPSLSDLPNYRMKGILNVFPIYPQDASQTCSIVTSPVEAELARTKGRASSDDEGLQSAGLQELIGSISFQESTVSVDVCLSEVTVVCGVKRDRVALNLIFSWLVGEIF